MLLFHSQVSKRLAYLFQILEFGGSEVYVLPNVPKITKLNPPGCSGLRPVPNANYYQRVKSCNAVCVMLRGGSFKS